MIDARETGLIYRNPAPDVRPIHAWHPSIVVLDDGEFVATYDLASHVEAIDYSTYVARSGDGGRSWSQPVPVVEKDPEARPSTHGIRISRVSGGEIVGIGGRTYRDDPDEDVVNRENLGRRPMDLFIVRSYDGGHSWEAPRTFTPPLVGPSWEVCHRIIELRDGRWLLPLATWRGFDGSAPNGLKSLAFVSHDRGATWPEYVDVMDQYHRGVISWEQSMIELRDGRLLVIAWAFVERLGISEPNPYTISTDGKTFSTPRSTGLRGQTTKILQLPDGRIFGTGRSDDQPGLGAFVAHLDGDEWITDETTVIWQGAASGMTGQTSSSGQELVDLKFGFPSLVYLPDGDVYVAFWCFEDEIYNIRWFRIRVT